MSPKKSFTWKVYSRRKKKAEWVGVSDVASVRREGLVGESWFTGSTYG